MAGDEGFEPPISGPEPGALPLGQSPILVQRGYCSKMTRIFLEGGRGLFCGFWLAVFFCLDMLGRFGIQDFVRALF
jgi:hypothetical protein